MPFYIAHIYDTLFKTKVILKYKKLTQTQKKTDWVGGSERIYQ